MDPRKRRRLVYLLVGACTVAVGVGLLVIAARSPGLPIKYHTWQMQSAWNEAFKTPDSFHNGLVGYTLGEDYERYTYHRQRLVELGAVREIRHKFQHIKVPTVESRHLSKLLLSPNRPNCIDFESVSPEHPQPMKLTVWCFAADADAWYQFIGQHDVPDYQARFMASQTK